MPVTLDLGLSAHKGRRSVTGLALATVSAAVASSTLRPPGAAGEWHIGAKRAFELFPGGLQARSKAERKKRWAKQQREAITAAAAQAAKALQEGSVRSTCAHADCRL
jgi:hypothetical protein